MAALLILLAGCTAEARPPSEAQVRADLAREARGSLPAACGYLGTTHLVVDEVRDVRFASAEAGTARLAVTNEAAFNPRKSCEVDVSFRYRQVEDQWALADLGLLGGPATGAAAAPQASAPVAVPPLSAFPADASVAVAGADGVVRAVPASSVRDEARSAPPKGDELQLGRMQYPVDDGTPVIPLPEVRGAPEVGLGRTFFVRRAGGRSPAGPGWCAAPVTVVDGDSTPALPWRSGAFYQRRDDVVRARPGGYVGVAQWGWWEVGGPGLELQAWTTLAAAGTDSRVRPLRELVAREGAAGEWDLVSLPEAGTWALVAATGPMPWAIYVVRAGE